MTGDRIVKFASTLTGVDGCIIENPTDLLYLTGLHLSKGRLWVTPKSATLFVDGRYFDRAKNSAPCEVRIWDEFKGALQQAGRIGFDSATLTFDGYRLLTAQFPNKEWISLSNPLKTLRLYKDAKEIEALKKAAQLTSQGCKRIIEQLKVGVTEEALAFEFEVFCRKNGASGLSFEPIIAFGENSAYPHYRAGKAELKNNQVVLIDVGAVVDQYHGDMTRVHFFGNPDPEIFRFEQIVREAKRKAIAHVRPGVSIGELDQIVCREFDLANVRDLYLHSLGHGIGLETHEYPRIKVDGEDAALILKAGMVFTIEPGLYQPGLGGIRIEDMILVTETGHVILTC